MIAFLQSDTTYWLLASALGLVGITLLLRGLIGWRAKGRARCWRCRYDMSAATGLACSECGYAHRDAKQLTRTRRFWGQAAAGLVLAGLACHFMFNPQIRYRRVETKEPWYVAATPMVGWILAFDWLDGGAVDLLDRRLRLERGFGTFAEQNDAFFFAMLDPLSLSPVRLTSLWPWE